MKHPLDLHHGHRRSFAACSRRIRSRPRLRRGDLVTMILAGVFGGLVWAQSPGFAPAGSPASGAAVRASFGLCHSGGGSDCVVDGDTFWMAGEKIRIADIDTPETHPSRCPREAELGRAATHRLHALLNSGAVSLAAIERDTDRYGRKLRVVSVDGVGVGETLVREGLARRYEGARRSWCD